MMPIHNVDIPIGAEATYGVLFTAGIFTGQPAARRQAPGHRDDLYSKIGLSTDTLKQQSHTGDIKSGKATHVFQHLQRNFVMIPPRKARGKAKLAKEDPAL